MHGKRISIEQVLVRLVLGHLFSPSVTITPWRLLATLAVPGLLLAGPVTTVPWNGHTGAVSFTYDDARPSQIPKLIPQLDSMKLKATFFISLTGTSGDFEKKKADWILAAKNGHELANHTRNHVPVPTDPAAAAIISDMATYLRAVDTIVQSVTFAYPGCGVNGKSGVGAENFVARGCGQDNYAWASQPPDWLTISGLLLNPSNVSSAVTLLNSAKSGNSWVVTVVHDVDNPAPDQYSITPADNKKMLDAAVSNALWVETFQNVAAYYRAHFVMDAATATANTGGWNLTWTSPNPKLPKRIPLRIKLAAATFGNSITVQQSGVTLPPESDGTYIIDFMKLSLSVRQGTVGIASRTVLPSRINPRLTKTGLDLDGVFGPVEVLVTDVRGARLFQGVVSNRIVPLPLPSEDLQGLLFLTLRDRNTGATVRTRVNATH